MTCSHEKDIICGVEVCPTCYITDLMNEDQRRYYKRKKLSWYRPVWDQHSGRWKDRWVDER